MYTYTDLWNRLLLDKYFLILAEIKMYKITASLMYFMLPHGLFLKIKYKIIKTIKK